MNTDPRTSRAFLSILTLPEGMTPAACAQLVEDASGMDAATLRLNLGKVLPAVVGFAERDVAARAVAAIRAAGGDAFAPTSADLEAAGPAMKIKHVETTEGGLAVDLWRGPSTMIRFDELEIIVRATLKTEQIKRDLRSGRAGRIGGSALAALYMPGTYLVGRAFQKASQRGTGAAPDKSLSYSDKIDIHTTNGLIYQIDGDKFGYQILGDLRGHSDRVNMDRMLELLLHFAPDTIVDTYFAAWSPPTQARSFRLPGLTDDMDRTFAFYSRWSALLYRHVLAG